MSEPPKSPKTRAEWKALVSALWVERTSACATPPPEGLSARVGAAIGGLTVKSTAAAAEARAAHGVRTRKRIMWAAIKYLLANRDEPGKYSKAAAAADMSKRVGASYEEVYELLTRLWPGRTWTHPPRPEADEVGALFGDDDEGHWLFEVDWSPKRKRGTGNR